MRWLNVMYSRETGFQKLRITDVQTDTAAKKNSPPSAWKLMVYLQHKVPLRGLTSTFLVT